MGLGLVGVTAGIITAGLILRRKIFLANELRMNLSSDGKSKLEGFGIFAMSSGFMAALPFKFSGLLTARLVAHNKLRLADAWVEDGIILGLVFKMSEDLWLLLGHTV